MTLHAGTKIGRYEILSQLGVGGMGEVYLADDSKLNRRVALKVLPQDVASKQGRMSRFVREAKAAAALNHPNIAHIYEIDEVDGHHFIAMEYIDGVTLREKILSGSSDLKELLRYLRQAAEALAKAHAAGIVHRDLKPDNVMITRDGYAKILDFGLAKLIEGEGDTETEGRETVGTGRDGEDQTIAMSSRLPVAALPDLPTSLSLPGTVMGTVGYMSPEQAQGKIKELDHRSDIFAFGCLLYEAATGRKAFAGKDALDSLHNIVHAPTPQIKDSNPAAPEDLQRIVRRCLAKDPDKRYQSIKEVAIELDELRQELQASSELHNSVQQTASGVASSQSSHNITQGSASDTTIPPESLSTRASSAEYIVRGVKQNKKIIFAAFALILFAAASFAIYHYWLRPKSVARAL